MFKYVQSVAVFLSIALAGDQLVIRNSADLDERSVDVRVTAPTSLPTYDAGTASALTSLAGTSASNATITGCTWTNSLGGSGSATGTTSWSVASIALTVGVNVITVTCTNNSGRSYIDVIAVTRSVAEWPDATNTGWAPTGVTLTAYTGPTNITVAGTVIDSKDITSCLAISASNVTIKRSRIKCNGTAINDWESGATGLLYEDVEVSCNDVAGTTGIGTDNFTARRVNVSECENGIWAGNNTLVEDSYIHDILPFDLPDCLDDPPGGDTDPCHTDGIQTGFSQRNITIRHNRIYGEYRSSSPDPELFGNAAQAAGGDTDDYLFENNLIAGGGYTARCEVSSNRSNYIFRNNRFSTVFVSTVGGYGAQAQCDEHAITFTGNVCHETGGPLSTCGGAPAPSPEALFSAMLWRRRANWGR